jgi:S-adenosylmethionine hydrolase
MSRPARAPRPWRPSGVVSLLTDYGLDDPYVGIVKGVLWRDAPRLRAIVDLSHAVPPGDVATAQFLLERSWSAFPAGSVHLAIVDPGVGTARALLLVEARGHVLLAPDNGLFAPLIASEPLVVVRKVGSSAPVRGPSTTFDGRDRFAPLAARLVEGDPPAAFGEVCASAEVLPGPEVAVPRRLADGSIAAEVIHVDRFGNLITNLPFGWLAEAGADWRERWSCAVGEHTLALVRTYADAAGQEAVALANSYDRMEIALARGSAARGLGLARGAEVRFVPRRAAEERVEERAAAGTGTGTGKRRSRKDARHGA